MPNKFTNQSEIENLILLLRTTDLSMLAISSRTGKSLAAVRRVNTRYNCRVYTSQTKWTVPAREGEKVDGGVTCR